MHEKNLIRIKCFFLIIIPATFLLLINSLVSEAGYADESTIIVTTKRVPSELKRTAENVQVYDEEFLGTFPARDLTELLKYLPGIDVRVASQLGQASSLSIQGSESRHVLLMVDGIPFNTQLSGQANPTRIPIDNIKQIEVVKGASSSSWGSSLGGVINVITKDVVNDRLISGRLLTSVAVFDTTYNSLGLKGGIEKLGYFATVNHLSTNGARHGADAEVLKYFLKGSGQVSDDIKIVGSFGHTDSDVYDIIPNPFFGRMDSYQPTVASYGQLQTVMDFDLLQVNAAVKYNHQTIKTDTTFLDLGGLMTSISGVDTYYGLSLNASYPFYEQDLLVVGADIEAQTFKVDPNVPTAETVRKQAPYINYTMTREKWDIVPGIRYDNNETFGSQVSPSVGVIYHFENTKESRLRFKASRVFNSPPLLWIHQETANTLPNPELEPETGLAYEMGFDTKVFSGMSVDANVYWIEAKDAIATVSIGSKSRKDNFDAFRRRGGDVLLNYRVNDQWRLYSFAGFNDIRDKSNEDIVKDFGVARQSFGWGVQYHTDKGFKAHLTGYYKRWSSPASLQPNDRKPIFDFKMGKDFSLPNSYVDAEIFLNVYNITNSKYWASVSFPLAERYVEGGLNIYF